MTAEPRGPSPSRECYSSSVDALRKFDVGAREALKHEAPTTRLEVLVRVIGSSDLLREELERSGLELHSATGPIASGVISVERLPELAGLSCVKRVELSRALHPELS